MGTRRTVIAGALSLIGGGLAALAASASCGDSFREGPLDRDAGDASSEGDGLGGEGASGDDDGAIADAGACLGDAAHVLPPRGTSCDGGAPPDFAADPSNCGACGHDCFGGGCARGICKPVAVASDPEDGGSPTGEGPATGAVGTLGGDLFWAHARLAGGATTVVDVMRMPRGGPSRLLATVPAPLTAATVDASGVYVASGSTLTHLDPDTGAAAPIALAGSSAIVELVATSSELYVIDAGGGIRAIAKTGGAPRSIASNENAPRDLLLAPPWIAWIDAPWTTNAGATGNGFVRVYGGTALKPLVLDKQQNPSGTFADGRRLYWFDVLGRALWAVTSDPASSESAGVIAGLPRPIEDAGTQAPVRGLLRDGTRVFVMLPTYGDVQELLELSTCGGPVTVLLDDRGQRVRGRMVQDDAFLYWTAYGGDVLRLAK